MSTFRLLQKSKENPMRVVLVEDDQRMQAELLRLLGALPGCSVVKVCDAAAPAIQWLQQEPAGWDLAIVDIFLKQGHGFEVLRQCEASKAPHQKAVMLSNYSRAPVASYAKAAGADRFFDKSLELDELVSYCQAFTP
jgi:DNA-binding NarL/FixJ family response regulator